MRVIQVLTSFMGRFAAPALGSLFHGVTKGKSPGEYDAVHSALTSVQLGKSTGLKESWAVASARAIPAAQMDEHPTPRASTAMVPVIPTLMFSVTADAQAL